jgi:hypothetical protein
MSADAPPSFRLTSPFRSICTRPVPHTVNPNRAQLAGTLSATWLERYQARCRAVEDRYSTVRAGHDHGVQPVGRSPAHLPPLPFPQICSFPELFTNPRHVLSSSSSSGSGGRATSPVTSIVLNRS